MATTQNLNNLVVNKVENKDVYNYMVTNDLINDDELYFVEGSGNTATTSKDGLMSAADKTKLNGLTQRIWYCDCYSNPDAQGVYELTVNGLIFAAGNILCVTFYNGFKLTNGTAKLRINGGSATYTIDGAPSGGYFIEFMYKTFPSGGFQVIGSDRDLLRDGGTMLGKLVAQNNTDYTTKQVRNVILVEDGQTLPSSSNGDIILVYTP